MGPVNTTRELHGDIVVAVRSAFIARDDRDSSLSSLLLAVWFESGQTPKWLVRLTKSISSGLHGLL